MSAQQAHLKVKICGTTTLADGLLAAGAGADAIGLIFAASKRQITPDQARTISLGVGPALGRVGVFLGQPLNEVLRVADHARLSAVQLHGRVPAAYLQEVQRYYPVILAQPAPQPSQGLSAAPPGVTLLLDAPQPGSGETLDWAALAPSFPTGAWLAGGLGPDNVAQAVATLRPGGVDAVSRLECQPGIKDAGRVRAFVQAARMAQASLVSTGLSTVKREPVDNFAELTGGL